MNNRAFKRLLKTIKPHVQADQKWKSQQREVLLHAMRAQTTSVKKDGLGRKMVLNFGSLVARPVGVFAMIFTVMFGSVIASVSAATNSTPGEILYPLKLTTERIQVSLVSNKTEKANLQISFAKKRLQEIKDVVKNEPDQTKAQEKIKQPIESLKSTIASVKIAVEDVKKEDNNNAIDIVANLKDVANIAADVAAEPAVAKAVAATEAADQKIVDDKAVNADKTNADVADKLNADGADGKVDTSVGAEIKKLIEETVTSTKDAQASVIRELALKDDKTQAKDEIKKYIELLKKEREVKLPAVTQIETNADSADIVSADVASTQIIADKLNADVTTTQIIADKTEVKKEAVVTTEITPTKAEIAIAEAQKIVDAKAVEDQKAFDAMIKQVEDLLGKDDVIGAMKILGIDNADKTNADSADNTNADGAATQISADKTDTTVTNTNTTK